MPIDFLLVAAGGAIGSMARYGAGLVAQKFWHHAFPLATFVINITGSLIIGLVAGWLAASHDGPFNHMTKLFLVVGLCGGFTTFSAFSLETLNLLKAGAGAMAFGYIVFSVLACIGATALGYALMSGGRQAGLLP